MFDSFASTSRFDFVGKWYDIALGRDRWIETEALITACIRDEDEEDGAYLVDYIYQVNGKFYEGSYLAEAPVDIGIPLSISYKPSNPKRNYLSGVSSGREPLVLIVIATGFGLFWLILHMMSRGYY
jgi:hypothetical protein